MYDFLRKENGTKYKYKFDANYIPHEEHFQDIVNKEVNFPIHNISEDMLYTKLKTF